MPTYQKAITFQVDYESHMPMHNDLFDIINKMFMSLPGVTNSFTSGGGHEITVNYGTYTSYAHDEYMRFVHETRLRIEELNEQYTDNKNCYEVL